MQIRLSSKEVSRLEGQGFTEEDIKKVVSSLDNVSKISSAQLDVALESLESNRAAIKEQAVEQEREEIRRNSRGISR